MDKAKTPVEDAAMVDLVKEFNYDESLDKQFDHNDVAVKKKKPFPCLPDKEPARPTIPITRLLSVVSTKTKVLMVVGSLAAAAQGVVFPAFSVVFGQLFNVFFTQTPDQIRYSASIIAGVFCALAVYNFIMGYLGQACWGLVGEEVGNHFRKQFFLSILRQEVGFFDNKSVGSLTAMLNTNIEHIRAGTGSKVGMWMMFFSQAIVGVIIAFVYSWKLTLVLIAISPLMGLGSVMQMRILAASTQSQAGAFQQATNLAIEVISGFSTVASFVWEPHARDRYLDLIDQTKKPRARTAHVAAVAFGLSFAFIFLCYALGFWYGAQLVAAGFPPANSTLNGTAYPPGYVEPGGISVGDMLIVFFSVIMGAMGLGQMFSVNPDFAAARASAYDVIQVINRVAKVDPNPNGVKDVALRGDISFRNVRFTFPARPGEEVIHGLTLDIPAGTIVGIVGHSGAGKSTLISLVERFYDCDSGSIFVDNVPLKDYDLHWLRGNIGLVSQEPILFDGTIADNIRFGKTDATMEEVIEAAKMANAHSFVEKLPHGYDTPCGQGGSLLSGGQKQRVAIARAVLKNPRIILLDEATSALDAESEHLVQDALQKLMHGRTTLVVAHRLSTIRDSDIIVVMDKGYIVEMGKHMELLMRRGFYYSLIARQMDTEDLKQINQMAASMSSFFASQMK